MKSLRTRILAMASVVAVSGLMMASVAGAADKLVVKDATGATTVFKVDDTGLTTATKIGLGTLNPVTTFHNVETTTLAARGITAAQHNDGAQGASIVFRKSRGTEAAPTLLAASDYIGVFQAQAWNGTSYLRSAQFGFRNDATPVGNTFPTATIFWNGDTTVLNEVLRLSSSANVGVGGVTDPKQRLEVNGGVRLNTAIAQPTCDVNARGTFWISQGATDTVQVCVQTGTGLAWKTLSLL